MMAFFDLRFFAIIAVALFALLAASVIFKSMSVANEDGGEVLPPAEAPDGRDPPA